VFFFAERLVWWAQIHTMYNMLGTRQIESRSFSTDLEVGTLKELWQFTLWTFSLTVQLSKLRQIRRIWESWFYIYGCATPENCSFKTANFHMEKCVRES
jgi:hypothetical protein